MNIKKVLIGIALPVLLLTGCGKVEDAVPAKEPAPSEITAAIMSEITIPSAVEKDKDGIGAYFTVDTAQLEDLSVYVCGSGAFPDELTVLKMTSAEQAQAAAEAVQAHLDSQIELYRDYTPNEMYKLDEASVTVKGDYVMLFVCENDARAMEIAESLF